MRTTMENNHHWQQKQKPSTTPATSTNTHVHSNISVIRGEGVKKEYGNIEDSHPRQQSSTHEHNNTFFGRPTSAPPPFDLGGNSLLLGLGNGSVGSDKNEIERQRRGEHIQSTHQEASWGAAANSADKRIFVSRQSATENDGGGSYNSLGSLDQPRHAAYDFGSDQTVNSTSNNRPTSSPLTEMMASRVPPGLSNNNTTNSSSNNNHNIIPSSDSSSTQDYDAVGMGIPRPASTGLIRYPQHQYHHHHHQQQQQQQQQHGIEPHSKNSTSSSVMGSLGLIQFDDIRGDGGAGNVGAGGGGVKHKSVMDWIQEDFPKTSSPEYPNVPLPTNPNTTNAVDGSDGVGGISAGNRYSTHNGQHYDSSSITFDSSDRRSQGVMSPYGVQAHPYKSASLPYEAINQASVSNNTQSLHYQATTTATHTSQNSQQQQHNTNAAYNQIAAQPAHILPSMVNNTHHHPHHILPLSNYDPQPQQIYYDDKSRGSPGGKEHPSTIMQPIAAHPPQVIQTTTASVAGNLPQHHPPPPPPPHAIYLNSVPAYGGYTTVYHHGPPPHPHHHPYTSLSNPPPILHTASQTAASVDPNMIRHSNTASATPPLGSEYISLPMQQTSATGITANGTYLYWQPPTHTLPLSHHAHHHPTPTVAVVDSNGRPTTITVSTGAPLPLTNTMNKHPQHERKGGEGKFGAGSKNSGRKSSGQRGAKKGNCAGTGPDKDSVGHVSTLLEDFHLGKSRSWTIHDVKGHIVGFCQDQNGSRFIQQRLEIATDTEQYLVLSEVLPSVRRLRNDVFGNYVVQKLFDHGNHAIKSELKSTLEGEMLSLSTQMYGCRVVQKALECVEEEDLLALLKEFRGHVITCIHDQNGNHVIQKCIEVISSRVKMLRLNKGCGKERRDNDENDYGGNAEDPRRTEVVERANLFEHEMQLIVNCVLETATSLSCHPYGCRVLQRILEHCTEDLKNRALDTIRKSHRVLLDDQYGNYVIQHVLQFGGDDDRDSILAIVVESGLLALSRQKFASNVVEKLLKYGNGRMRNRIVREMLMVVEGKTTSGAGDGTSYGKNSGSSVVLLMVRDAYANYVVQTTLDVVPEGEEKRLLLEELNRNSSLLRNYTFAKHIVTKLGTSEVGGSIT